MTAPVFLIRAGALDDVQPGAVLELDGDEGRHAATVRRIGVGEQVDLADGSGALARCLVSHAGRDRLVLRVESLDAARLRFPRLILAQALAKSGRDELAVETATELGVDAVVPWQAAHSVVVWSGERGERSRRRWEATARAAAKQSRRSTVPDIAPLATTRDLSGWVGASVLALVLHESAEQPLTAVDLPPAGTLGDVLVVAGPEGGIADGEVAALQAAGACVVRLGPEVLRTSSAGPAAIAVLSARLGRWS